MGRPQVPTWHENSGSTSVLTRNQQVVPLDLPRPTPGRNSRFRNHRDSPLSLTVPLVPVPGNNLLHGIAKLRKRMLFSIEFRLGRATGEDASVGE